MTTRRSIVIAALAVTILGGTASAQWVVGGSGEVNMESNGHSWLVRATLNGRVQGQFLLDTGATYCVLTPAAASRLGLPPSNAKVKLQTANGIVEAPLLQLPTIDVGSSRARNVPAVVHPAVAAPLDGIIGLSFLNNFTYSVDPRRRVLRLR